MIIFCNSKGEIKDVGVNSKEDETLTQFNIDDEDNPLGGFSNAKICCYKVTVIGGKITMMTPYLDSRLLEHIDQLGVQTEVNAEGIAENTENVEICLEGVAETYEVTDENSENINDCLEAIAELYEMFTD